MTSPDLTQANIDKIAELFPNVMTESLNADGNPERAVDFDLLRQELSGHIVEGPQERYRLDWPGKRAAAFAANAPIAKTLRPVREESVNFDTTKNLFIEGDNLDALKLLQESYFGKVKLIYIDPPYNTGNDFVYNDDFAESTEEYLIRSGQKDESGTRLTTNAESNGRFHSDWLSMMYPRLKLARNLLTSNGYIVVSIDDVEVSALELLLDEVMGAQNKLAVLVWDRNRKNDARYFSVGHEYMLVYARDADVLQENGTRLREPQAGIDAARQFVDELRDRFGDDWGSIQAEWRKWTSSFPKEDERHKLGRFSKVGERGPYRDDGNINWPGGGGPRYEVLHPTTGMAVKLPTSGWRFPTKARFDEVVREGRVVFGADESTVPRILSFLFESDGLVMGSVHYSYAQTAATDFEDLMGGKVFDNPKNWKDLRRIVEYLTEPGDLIVDFFAGSSSMAHAVLDANFGDGGTRRFIMVQLAEETDTRSEAASAGFNTIAELSRERIRRAGARLRNEAGLLEDAVDIGFRALQVDTTNLADTAVTADDLVQTALADAVSSVKPDRTGEDLLFQVLLNWGLELTMPIQKETVDGFEVYDVEEGALILCTRRRLACDSSLSLSRAAATIAERQPLRVVFLDEDFVDDAERINVGQVFSERSPHTEVKTI